MFPLEYPQEIQPGQKGYEHQKRKKKTRTRKRHIFALVGFPGVCKKRDGGSQKGAARKRRVVVVFVDIKKYLADEVKTRAEESCHKKTSFLDLEKKPLHFPWCPFFFCLCFFALRVLVCSSSIQSRPANTVPLTRLEAVPEDQPKQTQNRKKKKNARFREKILPETKTSKSQRYHPQVRENTEKQTMKNSVGGEQRGGGRAGTCIIVFLSSSHRVVG